MKKITILLPIHKINDDYAVMLKNALESIENFHNDIKLSVISPSDVHEKLQSFDFGQKLEVTLIENITGNNSFTAQINLGVDNCETEWFSILEIDDEYRKIWLPSMNEYMVAYPDVDVFLPIIKDVDVEGNFISYTNESVWAYGFTEKQGFLEIEALLEFQNYQTSGGLFKTKVFTDNGKFKDNIELTFTYELLLRLSNNGVNIMVVPKTGYQHVNFREDSLFNDYKKGEDKLTDEEVKFWLETAKVEYFYKNKRDILIEKK